MNQTILGDCFMQNQDYHTEVLDAIEAINELDRVNQEIERLEAERDEIKRKIADLKDKQGFE